MVQHLLLFFVQGNRQSSTQVKQSKAKQSKQACAKLPTNIKTSTSKTTNSKTTNNNQQTTITNNQLVPPSPIRHAAVAVTRPCSVKHKQCSRRPKNAKEPNARRCFSALSLHVLFLHGSSFRSICPALSQPCLFPSKWCQPHLNHRPPLSIYRLTAGHISTACNIYINVHPPP